MSIFEGTYKSLLEGVSQQTPQERRDGQLGVQVNMLSDKVTGLRRRGGVLLDFILNRDANCYIRIVKLAGEPYIFSIDFKAGTLAVQRLDNTGRKEVYMDEYFKAKSRDSFRTTTSRDNFFVVNTDKIPTKVLSGTPAVMPMNLGYASIRGSQFSKTFTITVRHSSLAGGEVVKSVRTADSTADKATPEWVAAEFLKEFNNDAAFKS